MLRKAPGWLAADTTETLKKNNQLKSPGTGNGMWNGGMKWRQEAATGGGATGGDRGRQEATLPPSRPPGRRPSRPSRPPTPSMRGLDDMVLGAVMAVEFDVLQFPNLFLTPQPPHV